MVNQIVSKGENMLDKIRSIDSIPKILVIIFLTTVTYYISDSEFYFSDNENMMVTSFSVIVFYFIFFGYKSKSNHWKQYQKPKDDK